MNFLRSIFTVAYSALIVYRVRTKSTKDPFRFVPNSIVKYFAENQNILFDNEEDTKLHIIICEKAIVELEKRLNSDKNS